MMVVSATHKLLVGAKPTLSGVLNGVETNVLSNLVSEAGKGRVK